MQMSGISERQSQRNSKGDDVGKNDRDPPYARNRRCVLLSDTIRMIQEAPFANMVPHQWSENQGQDHRKRT